jgi:tRNA pseudouridine synthase 9
MEGPTEATEESDPLAVDLGKLGLADDENKPAPEQGTVVLKDGGVQENQPLVAAGAGA